MTLAELDAMTLGDVEALAARLEKAASAMREMRALMGAPVTALGGDLSPDAHRLRQFQPPAGPPGGNPALTAAENAERSRLLGRSAIDPNLPDEIAQMERGS